MRTVLIAVDETEASVHAAEVAKHLFGDDARYLAVNVAARRVAREAGVPAEAMGEVGDPVDGILRAAGANDADVVVVGTKGGGWLSRLVSGSVSGDLVKAADLPVLLVR